MPILRMRFENVHYYYGSKNTISEQFNTGKLGITDYELRNVFANMLNVCPISFLPPKNPNDSSKKKVGDCYVSWFATNELIKKHKELYELAKSALIKYNDNADDDRFLKMKETVSTLHCGEQDKGGEGKGSEIIHFHGQTFTPKNNRPLTLGALYDIFFIVWDEFVNIVTKICNDDIHNLRPWEDIMTKLYEEYHKHNDLVVNFIDKINGKDYPCCMYKLATCVKTGNVADSTIRNDSKTIISDFSMSPRFPQKSTIRMDGEIYIEVSEEMKNEFLNGCGYATLGNGFIEIEKTNKFENHYEVYGFEDDFLETLKKPIHKEIDFDAFTNLT
ncbi:MAG: hypothetical protein MJZ34_07255 [Paludibacteraceae bacterium]|nr:hypothetical protein [Paludibacteraceae bacterium]